MSKKNKKLTITLEKVKPQNTAVLALSEVRGGYHEKTHKAKRKAEKQALKRTLDYSVLFLLRS